VVVPLLVLMVTLEAPTAVTVPCNGRAAPIGGGPKPDGPLAGAVVELEFELVLEPPAPEFPAVDVVVVVAALALTALDTMPPARAPTPSRAIPLIFALFILRRPPPVNSVCGCIVLLLPSPPDLGGQHDRAPGPFEHS